MTILLIGIAGLAALAGVALLVGVALAYNGLISRRNRVVNAWSQVDVQLKRRHDLIPNLVATVQGYATHERNAFLAVTEARGAAIAAHGPAQQGPAELALAGAVRGLLVVAEAYPTLKASSNFLELQQQLADVEGRIAYARQFYNNAVLGYNDASQTFPRNIVAGIFRFEPGEFFAAAEGEREVVAVKFN
jgi:LemA protein